VTTYTDAPMYSSATQLRDINHIPVFPCIATCIAIMLHRERGVFGRALLHSIFTPQCSLLFCRIEKNYTACRLLFAAVLVSYRVRQANFLFHMAFHIQKRKLACRTCIWLIFRFLNRYLSSKYLFTQKNICYTTCKYAKLLSVYCLYIYIYSTDYR
jgi:hypothetical protein